MGLLSNLNTLAIDGRTAYLVSNWGQCFKPYRFVHSAFLVVAI
jgi:hypothetical protein